ncbi:hypothetical protein cyc_00193 [Cyclospora cayetanensis]|uniref:Uncharacterized protein n=1 Tax=Cyclospora cayetanensis TaxID=88456 RepID=A0A1D3D5S9_9EIME|nr:hypothetical protein cyc_00193 [Cyclospora cayetanensis]
MTAFRLCVASRQVECPSHGGAVFSLCLCPPELSLPSFAAACDDGRIRLFRLEGPADRAFRELSSDPYVNILQSDDGEEEIRVAYTLPKTRSRLLSVCWYSSDLIFAGNAASCILRFSRGGAQQPFVADGKMVLQSGQAGTPGASVEGGVGSTLVWNLRALPSRSLLVSGDSRGCVTLWSLPACVALRSLQVHVADVLDMEVMVCVESFIDTKNRDGAPLVKMQQEVILSVGVDGKLSAISRTEEDRWVVRACRFPHLCDSQAIACVRRIPGGQDASWVVTGAADGSLKYLQQLTELAGLKAPCLPFCASPALQGLQKPKVLWKKRLIVCPSEDDIGIWHIEEDALQAPPVTAAKSDAAAPLVQLARITLQGGAKIRCCDATKDGQLVAVGSNQGLRLFAFHLKELDIQDLECLGACRISEMVTSLHFVSRSVLACCYFSRKPRRTVNCRRLRQAVAPSASPSIACDPFASEAVEGKVRNTKGESEGFDGASSGSKKWEYSDMPSAREAAAIPDHLTAEGGSFCVAFIKISTGQELAAVRDLPFPVVSMSTSPDGSKLGCLNSNSSILVFDVAALQPTHIFPNIFRKGESVAAFCFSPDSAKLFVLGTRNGYYIVDVQTPESSSGITNGESCGHPANGRKDNNASSDAAAEGCTASQPSPTSPSAANSPSPARKRIRQHTRRNVRSISAKELSRGDGCIIECRWVEGCEDGESACVLCLLPSGLFKVPFTRHDSSEGNPSGKAQKKHRKDLRLLDVSSDSGEERDEQQLQQAPSQTRRFPPRLKKLHSRRGVMIGPPPLFAASFCVPRVLPASLLSPSAREEVDGSVLLSFEASCLSPSGSCSSTRSTVTTPGDSPVSDGRSGTDGTTGAAVGPMPLGEFPVARAAKAAAVTRAIRQSESKGFIGFAFERWRHKQTEEGKGQTGEAPADHALVLLEAINCVAQSKETTALPRFNRKRYGT